MRHWEDFTVGLRFTTRAAEVSERDIVEFARRFDAQPMHLDAQAALSGPLKGLSASGWQTASLVNGLMVEADLTQGGPWLGLGVDELQWPAPVRPGDTIQAEIEVVSTRPSRSQPAHGIVRMHTTARNQRGDVVLSMYPNVWVPRREP
ncbi:MAG TPA: MaoC family dehydratase [Bryobacteraceae bacterium]|nr:MaoC family dehydratase [Bryobacteraceae bacterium]